MTTVHVLTYSHRHGETVSVYSTEEKAQKAAAMTVADYIDEVHRPDERRQIAKALNAQDYAKALNSGANTRATSTAANQSTSRPANWTRMWMTSRSKSV